MQINLFCAVIQHLAVGTSEMRTMRANDYCFPKDFILDFTPNLAKGNVQMGQASESDVRRFLQRTSKNFLI